MIKVTAFIICMLASIGAHAFTISSTEVKKVFVGYTHEGIFFNVASAISTNPNNCGVGNNATFSVDPELSNVNQVLSVLLAAQASGKKLEVEVYDDKCFQNHRVIRKIVIF